MAITEHSPPIPEFARKRRVGTEGYIMIIGGAAVALFAVARLIYEPSWHDKELAMQAAIAAEHAKVCDQLGKPMSAPDRDNCLKVLDSLYSTHQQAILADISEI